MAKITRMSWTPYRLNRLYTLIEEGVTANEIAEYFGVSRSRIYQVLHKHSIECPEHQKLRRTFTLEEYVIYRLVTNLKNRKRYSLSNPVEYTDLLPVPLYCPVLNIPLDYQSKTNISYRTDNSPSLDRVDNTKGYTPENTVIMSWRANRIKNDGTAEEHEAIAKFIRTRL